MIITSPTPLSSSPSSFSPSFLLKTKTKINNEKSSLVSSSVSQVSVRFNSKCYIKRIISRYDYTTDEIDNCWYTKHELDNIWSNCIDGIHKLNTNKNNQNQQQRGDDNVDNDVDNDFCVRGLECTIFKKQNRQKAANAVFMEQQQYNNNTLLLLGGCSTSSSPVEESIATKYNKISYKCQLLAIAIALRDQRNAAYI